MFVSPLNVIRLQQDLKEYELLCKKFRYTPAKKEFEDIAQFILLHSGNGTGIYESFSYETVENYLYENFIHKLNEFEAGGDTAQTAANLGAEALSADKFRVKEVGKSIIYFIKSSAVKKPVQKIYDESINLLGEYNKIYDLKVKKAKLEGSE
jgi:hypothetical protein